MNDFVNSLKSDLSDRRFLPVLALLAVALVAALAYAVLGGGSSTSSTPPVAIGASTGAAGASGAIAISQAPASSNKAVAETTSGAPRHPGSARNPFTPLPAKGAKLSATASSASTHVSSSPSTSASSGSGQSTSNAGATTPPATPKPAAPAKPKVYIHYHVTAEFGVLPVAVEGAPPQAPQLKTYTDMALDEPLPAKENPQLVFLGVVLSTGKDAVFALTGEAILHGSATCKPSPTQCQAIQLSIGQAETLEVVESNGQPATYELKLVGISKSLGSASGASAHAASSAKSKAGRELLGRAGLSALPGLHYSPQRGGLVPVGHAAFGAHAARHR